MLRLSNLKLSLIDEIYLHEFVCLRNCSAQWIAVKCIILMGIVNYLRYCSHKKRSTIVIIPYQFMTGEALIQYLIKYKSVYMAGEIY